MKEEKYPLMTSFTPWNDKTMWIGLGIIFTTTLALFYKAFTIPFVLDDFFFLSIGKAQNFTEFITFFSPFKGFFYRPLTTEVFYFFINISKQNIFLAHSIAFLFYFIGLTFLYQISHFLTKSKLASWLFVFFYAITFTHVFQLYMFNTFQEIAQFTFLSIAAYFYLRKLFFMSILFFIFALMSKESAIIFPGILFVYTFYETKLKILKSYRLPFVFLIISALFFLIYQHGASTVEQIDIYKIHLSPKLILNNLQWYFLWNLGFPNFYPNYTSSIFSLPTADFWNLLNFQDYKIYFYSFLSFYGLMLLSTLLFFIKSPQKIKKTSIFILLMIVCFVICISPTLPIIHRWMVRLTMAGIFIAAIQAYLIYQFYLSGKLLRVFSLFLIGIFITLQYFATIIHESSSLIFLEAEIANNTRIHIQTHKKDIEKSGVIYFADTKDSPFGGSKKLKLSLHNQDFLEFYLPNEKIKAIYGIDEAKPPKGSFVVSSTEIINGKK